jgi:SAM-dependent methyltransferase
MLTRSDDYVEYCRETAKHARDPHDLALRGRKNHAITRRIHERIARAVDLRPADDVVDIGCGDGTFLRMANSLNVHSALGLLATEEEVEVLRHFGLNVRQGYTDHLPVADETASVIVCNNVLLMCRGRQFPPVCGRSTASRGRAHAFFSERSPSSRRKILRLGSRPAGNYFRTCTATAAFAPGSEWCAAWPGGRSPEPRR